MNLVDTSRSVSCLVVIEDGEGESTEDGPYEVTVVPAPPACEGLTPKPKAIRVRPARLRSRPSRRRQALAMCVRSFACQRWVTLPPHLPPLDGPAPTLPPQALKNACVGKRRRRNLEGRYATITLPLTKDPQARAC